MKRRRVVGDQQLTCFEKLETTGVKHQKLQKLLLGLNKMSILRQISRSYEVKVHSINKGARCSGCVGTMTIWISILCYVNCLS